MKIYSIYILNKAGGLIYQNDVTPGLRRLSANDYLVLAGTLHGVHAIGARLTPSIVNGRKSTAHEQNEECNSSIISAGKTFNPNTNRSGLQSIETDLFNLYVFQVLTGLKFIIVTTPNPVVHNMQPLGAIGQGISSKQLQIQHERANDVFRLLYQLYADYVMKDPFYSLDMPIKSSLFDAKVKELANI